MLGVVATVWLALAMAGAASAWAGDLSDSGICARCHATQAQLAAEVGGHAATLDCLTCHEERRPGVFGRGHRAIPTSCTGHHTAAGFHARSFESAVRSRRHRR
jgi:hypothetical protein